MTGFRPLRGANVKRLFVKELEVCMRIRGNVIAGLCVAALLPLVAACGDDDIQGNVPSSPVVGTWIARSLETPNGDAIEEGMSMIATVGDAGTISFNIYGDQLGICNPGPDCNLTGTWTSTDNTLTIDSNNQNTTVSYSIEGDSMTWIGTLDGQQVEISFNRIL